MNRINMIVVVALVACGFLIYSAYNERADLKTRLTAAELDSTTLRREIEALESRVTVTVPIVAEELMSGHSEKIVALVTRALMDDDETVTELRGPVGQPDNDAIAAGMMENGAFVAAVVAELWAQRREEITLDEAVIATVAGAVYEQYGPELKGEPAAPVPIAEIAQSLADDPGFALLLSDLSAGK